MTAATKHDYPHFVAIQRIMRLPVVSFGFNKATYVYVKVKVRKNNLLIILNIIIYTINLFLIYVMPIIN